MNDKIKERVQAILCNYGLDDDWFFPIAQENTKTGNVAEMDIRASKAYQYLLDHAKEITFTEFEEVFFVLITTAYEYERNIETPVLQLLSDEVLHRTDAVFSQDKKDYLYQICKLMQKQFGAFLYFRDLYFRDSGIPKTKARILPLFTPYFDSEYWNMIKADAEKALVSYPDGEIANRLVCISDVAVYGSMSFENFAYNREEKLSYEELEKYLDSPRKDFLSECFSECFEDMYSEIPQHEFPLIKPNYDLNDHDDLVKNLDMFDDEVYQEVINNYLLRVLHHALVNPAILSFFGKNVNPVTANVKLSQANNQKIDIFNAFSHKFSNRKATTLEAVGESLLSIDDDDTRDCGRLVMMECSFKKDMAREVEILTLEFGGKLSLLLKKIRETSFTGELTVSDILAQSLKQCFLSLLYDVSDSGKKLNLAFFGKQLEEEERFNLQLDYENKVLIPNQPDDIYHWLDGNKRLQLHIEEISSFWEKLRFAEGGYTSIILTDWISEFFRNIFKYADKSKPVFVYFSESDTTANLKIKNAITDNIVSGTQLGLKNIRILAEKMNALVNFSEVPLIIKPNEYSVELRLCKKIFYSKGD